ncbi:MAG: nucleotidyl transferase AbiEii/AbiGii toxin family protein [Sulfurimonas sp.]
MLPKTKSLLLEIVESCDFLDKYVLVGGSALTLHLCHRKSEDLDFFTFEDNFDLGEIFEYIKQFSQKEILKRS